MDDLPVPVCEYLHTLTLATRAPAYVFVDSQGVLQDWGGALQSYGFVDLQRGKRVEEQMDLLLGCFPLADGPLHFPCVETPSGLFADLHLLPVASGVWVLLLDATVEAVQRRLLQQKANELVLLQEHYTKIFGRHQRSAVAEDPVCLLRQAMLTAALLAEVFRSLDTVVLEHTGDRAFRLLSQAPEWFTRLYPEATAHIEALRPGEQFPFLENFLIDAEQVWETSSRGQVKSGPWTEVDSAGQVYNLEAAALCVGRSQVLCLAFPHMEYAEKQALVQKAREERLEYIQLQKEIQKKDILLHCIVHDLAGPLTSIMGSLEFLQEETLSADGREFLEISRRQGARQQRLIQQILEVFATEMGALETFARDRAQAPDAARCARDVVQAMAPAGAARRVRLSLHPQVDLSADWQVVGETSRLERVLVNLVENALRHSPPGTSVLIDLQQADDEICIAVDDAGPGIAPEMAATLFDKFSQGQGQHGKAGLGLYFCRITVEHWGGRLGCSPRPGGGSRFWFCLPRPALS
ncbi:MAG: sensor histidine kinase [Candidatus Tectimicrobiota bacterium]